MVVNFWNTSNVTLSEQLLLSSQSQQVPLTSAQSQVNSNSFKVFKTQLQLRDQLCAIQNNIQQLSPLNHQLSSSASVSSPRSAFTSPDPTATPLNPYSSQATSNSASLLLAAQLLFSSENTPPQLTSTLNSSLLSPGALMDTSHMNGSVQNGGSANSADGKLLKLLWA